MIVLINRSIDWCSFSNILYEKCKPSDHSFILLHKFTFAGSIGRNFNFAPMAWCSSNFHRTWQVFMLEKYNCDTTWQNQQNKLYVPSGDSDQPGHLPSLIRVFAVCSMDSEGHKVSSCRHWRLIRLGGCTGCSAFSLGTQVILLVLSCDGSVIL